MGKLRGRRRSLFRSSIVNESERWSLERAVHMDKVVVCSISPKGLPSADPRRRVMIIIKRFQQRHQMQRRTPNSTKMKDLM